MDIDVNSKLQLSFLSFFFLPTRTTQLYNSEFVSFLSKYSTSYSKLSTPYRLSHLFSTPAAQNIAIVEPDSPPSPRNRRKIGSIVSTSPKPSGTPHHLSPFPNQIPHYQTHHIWKNKSWNIISLRSFYLIFINLIPPFRLQQLAISKVVFHPPSLITSTLLPLPTPFFPFPPTSLSNPTSLSHHPPITTHHSLSTHIKTARLGGQL